MKRNLRKAFTLVEMLIVVIIIGILMAALLPRLKGAQERARDTARKANLSQISTALEMYFNDNGSYPDAVCTQWPIFKKALVPTYMNDIPRDPQKQRITYGTRDWWCGNGQYAYRGLYRNWAKLGWCVLIANVEAEGRVWNFVLVSDDQNIDFDPTQTSNKRAGTNNITSNTTTLTNTDWKLEQDDHFRDADVAENAVCQTVEVDTTVDDYGKGCWGWASLTNWTAKTNPYMVYVRFN